MFMLVLTNWYRLPSKAVKKGSKYKALWTE